jgi:hypothetical protein
MPRSRDCWLVVILLSLVAGCGGGTGIEPGMPKDAMTSKGVAEMPKSSADIKAISKSAKGPTMPGMK